MDGAYVSSPRLTTVHPVIDADQALMAAQRAIGA
jgi:hypothetical protein